MTGRGQGNKKNYLTKSQSASRPNLYAFHDYRKFLELWIPYLKKKHKGYSLTSIAKASGVSLSYLSMVVKGVRSLSIENLSLILPHLKLDEQESSYFTLLQIIADSQDPAARLEALKKAHRFLKYKEQNTAEVEVYQYLTKWYFVAIREMAGMDDFNPSPEWIQSRLREHVSLKDIEGALGFLTANGYIDLSKKASERIQKDPLTCEGGVYKVALAEFHKQMLGMQERSIHDVHSDDRFLTAHMLAIPQEKFQALKTIIDEARAKVAALGKNHAGSNSVYYVSLGTFPITAVAGQGGDHE